VVELIHPDLNPRFDIYVVFMTNYFLVGGDVFVDSETLLVTDFIMSRSSRLSLSDVLIEIGCVYSCL
jgi:hypothetical protein